MASESVQEFLEDKGFVFDQYGSTFSGHIIEGDFYIGYTSFDITKVYKDCLDYYLKIELSRHWQLFGGTIPFAQYLDASVVADIRQALAYWQALNDK